MIRQQDIQRRDIDGKSMTFIAIGNAEGSLPRHMLQGKKQPGFIVRGERMEPWYWEGFTEKEETRYVYFPELDLIPISSLCTTLRPQALDRTKELAASLQMLPKDFLQLNNGIIPLWRIYFLPETGILFFPEDLSDIIAATGDADDRYDSIGSWIRHGMAPSFTLCNQLTQLLYFSATGIVPYASADVREDKFRALPLTQLSKVLAPQLAVATAQWIDETMALSQNNQKKLTEGMSPVQALSWWLDAASQLCWSLPAGNETSKLRIMAQLQEDPTCATLLSQQEKRAMKKAFWRVKGWIIILSVIILGGVATFAGTMIKRSLTPPYTAGMNQSQVILEYYAGQNELDIQKLEASFTGKAKSPVAMEVSNLFVTRQMRQAYEGVNTVISVTRWNEAGRGAIPNYAYIYGVDDIKLVQTGENTWTATSTLYSPYDYEDIRGTDTPEEQAASPDSINIYRYEQVQEFTLEYNKRGWWEISHIGDIYYTPLEPLQVELYTPQRTSVGAQALTQGGLN